MANVNIKFNGKDFLLSCEDGQEEHLEELALNLNKKFDDLKNSLGNIGESKLLLISSITIMDEYFETKKKIEKQKVDLTKITERFKELKSLVYEYKEDKEIEIEKLKTELNDLKIMIEKSKNSYEKILDKTTKSIEKFIENAAADQEKKIQ